MEVRFLEPEEFGLVNEYFLEEGVPPLDPEWSRVIATFDDGKVVGIMCLQLVAHVEPIIVHPDYRGTGIWRPMAEMMDGYVAGTGLAGAYCQPMNEKSKAIASKMGYEECESPLYRKLYDQRYLSLRLQEE